MKYLVQRAPMRRPIKAPRGRMLMHATEEQHRWGGWCGCPTGRVFPWRSLGALLLLVQPFACGPSGGNSQPLAPPTQDSGPTEPISTATSIAFDPDSTLTLLSGESREISVVVQPPGQHLVRFALLGGSLDASLDRDERSTDPQGRASVTLTAPRSASTFRLRASADDGPSAEIAVSVSDDGFASVWLQPSYSGKRQTRTWTASAVARTKCADLPGIPPDDGPIVSPPSPATPVLLEKLPVGPDIAVTLRAGYSLGGCEDISDLTPGEVRTVTVKVADRPIDLTGTDLDLAVVMSPDGEALAPLLATATESFLDGLMPPGQSEAATILDGMEGTAPDPQDFAAARLTSDWDQALSTHLDDRGESLRGQASSWIDLGFEPLRSGAALTGRVRANTSSSSHGVFALDTLGGLDAHETGTPIENLVSLSTEPGDIVLLGGAILWLPSRLVAAAGLEGARQQAGSPLSPSDALQTLISCSDLADALALAGPLPASCMSACIEAACGNALPLLWQRARDTSTVQDLVTFSFTISADAGVDEYAVVSSFQGSWVGTVTWNDEDTATRGVATASPGLDP